MNYTYENLASQERSGVALGEWNGYTVYAGSKRNIQNFDSKNMYVLYDDENKLYRGGFVYGSVKIDGSVKVHRLPLQYRRVECYEPPVEKPVKVVSAKTGKEVEPQDIDVMGLLDDITRDTEKMLAEACEW